MSATASSSARAPMGESCSAGSTDAGSTERLCHVEHEIDVEVPRRGVGDRPLHLVGRPCRAVRRPPLDRPRGTPTRHGRHQHEPLRLELLESLRDCHGAVGEILDEDARSDVAEPLEREAAEVEVALVEVRDAPDEHARPPNAHRAATIPARIRHTCVAVAATITNPCPRRLFATVAATVTKPSQRVAMSFRWLPPSRKRHP